MTSTRVDAFSQPPTMLSRLTLAVESGTGTLRCALSVLNTGSSTRTEYVSPSVTGVPRLTRMVPACPATLDTTSPMEPASFPPPTMPDLRTSAVVSGTGTTECACHALVDGSSAPLDFATKSLKTAENGTTMERVPHASRGTILLMVPVSSLNQTTPDHLMLDVVSGTGMLKSVCHARGTGSSTLLVPVSQLAISVQLVMPTDHVLAATRDIASTTEHVSSLSSTTLSPPTPAAEGGTGTTRCASSAPKDGPSTPTTSASLSATSAENTTLPDSALLASRATISLTVLVSSPSSTTPSPPMPAARLGTGMLRCASSARRTGFSTPLVPAFP